MTQTSLILVLVFSLIVLVGFLLHAVSVLTRKVSVILDLFLFVEECCDDDCDSCQDSDTWHHT